MSIRFKQYLGIVIKNHLLNGAIVMVLGLLIAFGPRYLFKVCTPDEDGFPRCHWSAQAEIGIGALITVLGLGLMLFKEQNIRLGLTIGIFFAAVIALSIPHALIGGCGMMSMACRRTAFPFITLFGIVLLVYSAMTAVLSVPGGEETSGRND